VAILVNSMADIRPKSVLIESRWMNSGSKPIPAIHVPFRQERMKVLRASPVSFCSPALALQSFIFCCCEFTAGSTAVLPERRSDMQVPRVSPARCLGTGFRIADFHSLLLPRPPPEQFVEETLLVAWNG